MKQLKHYHKHLLFFFLLLCSCDVKAQRADSLTYRRDSTYLWFGGHIGGGSLITNIGLDAATMWNSKYLLAVKADWGQNTRLYDNSNVSTYNTHESSLLFGLKLSHHQYHNWMAFSGISYISMSLRGDFVGRDYDGYLDYQTVNYNGMGLPLMLKYMIAPSAVLAMDFSASANINAKRSFFSVTFGLSLGNIRDKDTRKLSTPSFTK